MRNYHDVELYKKQVPNQSSRRVQARRLWSTEHVRKTKRSYWSKSQWGLSTCQIKSATRYVFYFAASMLILLISKYFYGCKITFTYSCLDKFTFRTFKYDNKMISLVAFDLMVQCSRNWIMSPNIVILVWVTMTLIDHWFIHMLLIVDWLIHICNWLLIGLFITLLMVDWFIYYTTYGWLVYLLRYWLTIGFQDLERVEERHLFMSRVKKKKNNNTLRTELQNLVASLHLWELWA